ncbi:transcription factor MafB [Prunus yedoensis var. nudiflora]|uniref:Transcription factor MafB n=1 Tax=Prunus yedoensis var. nudiflora TaxID=2094558 RepID=A0A314ZDV2_PRUYE|nr:transcription factor MafB [Prunus yedoensis var. nudiflora]
MRGLEPVECDGGTGDVLRQQEGLKLIPTIPKLPHDRFNHLPLSSVKYHQSMTRNIPVLANAMRNQREFDAVDDSHDDNEGEGEMLPPLWLGV